MSFDGYMLSCASENVGHFMDNFNAVGIVNMLNGNFLVLAIISSWNILIVLKKPFLKNGLYKLGANIFTFSCCVS